MSKAGILASARRLDDWVFPLHRGQSTSTLQQPDHWWSVSTQRLLTNQPHFDSNLQVLPVPVGRQHRSTEVTAESDAGAVSKR